MSTKYRKNSLAKHVINTTVGPLTFSNPTELSPPQGYHRGHSASSIQSPTSSTRYRATSTSTGFTYDVTHVPSKSRGQHEGLMLARCQGHHGIMTCHGSTEVPPNRTDIPPGWLLIGDTRQDNLQEALARGSFRGRPDLVIDVIIQVCDALSHCHQRGVAHGDIRPDNIIITSQSSRTGKLTIQLDGFGLARAIDRPSPISPSSHSRTPSSIPYMAPEAYGPGSPCDPRHADVWAVGVLICVLTTDFLPWLEPTDVDSGFEYLREEGADRALREMLDLPERLHRAAAASLVIDAKRRISIHALLDMLQGKRRRPSHFSEEVLRRCQFRSRSSSVDSLRSLDSLASLSSNNSI